MLRTTVTAIERFVYQLYQPHTGISKVSQVTWWLFTKAQAQSEKLTPTPDTPRNTWGTLTLSADGVE